MGMLGLVPICNLVRRMPTSSFVEGYMCCRYARGFFAISFVMFLLLVPQCFEENIRSETVDRVIAGIEVSHKIHSAGVSTNGSVVVTGILDQPHQRLSRHLHHTMPHQE